MIPYWEWHVIQLGPITLQVWGIFVALGFGVGALAAGWFAKKRGDNPAVVYDLVGWLVITGLIGGRLGHVLLYEPSYYLQHPFEILALWNGGLSMFGGLIVSSIFAIWYLRRQHVDVWRYADIVAFGLPFGKWIGRIGCFLIHDHPGTATDFFLGVQYPDGVTRHDHGLYLSINGFLLAIVMLVLSRKPRPVGTYVAVFALSYG
ncbi:MAG: Prolipoprotein diacylglyceryl transferase, partial [Candidatus Uhrbacteria bacterium GW2011_GWD2_52_7]